MDFPENDWPIFIDEDLGAADSSDDALGLDSDHGLDYDVDPVRLDGMFAHWLPKDAGGLDPLGGNVTLRRKTLNTQMATKDKSCDNGKASLVDTARLTTPDDKGCQNQRGDALSEVNETLLGKVLRQVIGNPRRLTDDSIHFLARQLL